MAAEIFEAGNRAAPRSSSGTTCNNLRDLVRAGLVREVAVEGHAARFEVKDRRYYHLIYNRCGKVAGMERCDVPRPAPGPLGNRVLRECELIFRGLCAECTPRKIPFEFGRLWITGPLVRTSKSRQVAIARIGRLEGICIRSR